jgi:hypothetical protein
MRCGRWSAEVGLKNALAKDCDVVCSKMALYSALLEDPTGLIEEISANLHGYDFFT